MDWIEAIILGIIQGLTEFLPVSSSGHLEIGKALLGVEAQESLIYTVVVHGATVLSTIVVFRQEILKLIQDFFKFKWNESTQYIVKIGISMIPVLLVGIFFKDQVESLFTGNILLVGFMLLFTAILLSFTYFSKSRKKDVGFWDALIIGIAQAVAVLPGISRSGSTIATGILLGNKKENVAKFSFLMVLLPIIGANLLDIASGEFVHDVAISPLALGLGFISAFVSGLLACKLMIRIVNKGKLIYFAIYCLIVGVIAIISAI
ncbi:MAG: undecaprenyl-diphosphate phosphatase [Hyphomicrobiales bacterium]